MMRGRTLLALGMLACSLAPAAAGAIPGAGHLLWVEPDRAWTVAAATLRANGDATPDVAVVAGHRNSPYIQCGNGPWTSLNQAGDTVLLPGAELRVLDGATGAPLWSRAWGPSGPGSETPTHWEQLEGLLAGNLDGAPGEEVLVLRSSIARDRSEHVQRATLHEGATGAVRWSIERTFDADMPRFQQIQPMQVFGDDGALFSRVTMNVIFQGGGLTLDIDVESAFVRITPDGFETVAELPDDLGMVLAIPRGDGYRLVSQVPQLVGFPQPTLGVDLEVIDMTREEEDGEIRHRFERVWSRRNAGGSPAVLAGRADDPLLVVGKHLEQRRGMLVAIRLADGSEAWTDTLDVGPHGGTLLGADVNGDGIGDLVASPEFGSDPAGVLAESLSAELVALEGRTGTRLWSVVDPTAKFRAFSLQLADVDGDGTPEAVAGMAAQDGFPVCSTLADDPGMIGVYELATGAVECRLHTDRFPSAIAAAQLDATPGEDLAVGTYGGTTYAFRDAEPGCGLAGTLGLPLG